MAVETTEMPLYFSSIDRKRYEVSEKVSGQEEENVEDNFSFGSVSFRYNSRDGPDF